MLEFVTQDAEYCPYCRGELRDVVVDDIYKKFCKGCYKMFEIAYFNSKEITNES
jgi:thiol-disulfide isomerase/thioredoxin